MGVYGLWRLLDASGKAVPIESLDGKVLAVDISIWIYTILQGYKDHHGASKPNAHLLGLFTRICKLLYYKIKPVFVFDGGVPLLKRNTIALRRKQKSIATSKAQKMKADLINNLIKHSMVKTVLNKESRTDQTNEAIQLGINKQTSEKDMFALPDMPSTSNVESYISDNDSDTSVELSPRKQSKWMGNIHHVDVANSEFKALPADVRYDILNDLKETRKQNSWGRLHEMPEESHNFSSFQLKRLLKRRYVQESLESAEKEMGGKTLTLEELDKLLTEQGIDTKGRDVSSRIAADSTTRLIYINDKNALARNNVDTASELHKNDTSQSTSKEIEPVAGPSTDAPIIENMNEYELNEDFYDNIDIIDDDDSVSIIEDINEYTLDSNWKSEFDMNESRPLAKKYFGKNTMNPALTYMLEYSGLSQEQIMHLIKHNKDGSHKTSSKRTRPSTEDTCLELIEIKNSTNNESVSTLIENSEKSPKSITLENTQDTSTDKDNTNSVLISSNSQSSNFIETESLKENNNIQISDLAANEINKETTPERRFSPVTGPNDLVQKDTSDSDSDSNDFIEVQDVPIPDVNVSKNIIKKENIEITIKSDGKVENDIFADIFEKTDGNLTASMNCPKQGQIININEKHEKILICKENHNSIKDNNEDNHKHSLLASKQEQIININEKHEKISICEENDNSIKDNDEDNHKHSLLASSEKFITEKSSIESLKVLIDKNNDPIPDESSSKSTDDADAKLNPHNKCVIEKPVAVLPTNEKDLITLQEQLETEQEELTQNINKFMRQATNISDQIKSEAQDLLRLFGIPYIVAPMEAEAQCAYLEQINLTDGTITDDSDIWLFGGKCVYKNFFNNKKNVLQFHACDIQHHFKLTRNQLIQLALLVGSDYTTGIAGIGPVTALEILAAFPSEGDNLLHGMHKFCSWINKGKVAGPGKAGLRNKLRNIKLGKDFPSQAVVQAYLFPTVDESKEIFTWGKPNTVLLSDYARQKFGWTKAKFEDIMLPVLKRMEEKQNQKLLDSYFKLKIFPKSVESNLSKRVQKAVHKLNNEDMNEIDTDKPRSKKIKRDNTNQEFKKQEKTIESNLQTNDRETVVETRNTILDIPAEPVIPKMNITESIPQREKDKESALKKKLHAIEVFRKSKQGLARTRKVKRTVRKIKQEAELSESDSN